jgi:predicted RNA methylase
LVKKYVKINNDDLIIEPSAGNGSFISGIKTLSNNHLFYDLEPEHTEIIKQDYLTLDYQHLSSQFNNIHIIGNPPFGRQSSMAIKFIKWSCNFCNSLSFILPKSFKKDTLKHKFPLMFHLVFEQDLPKNSFLVDDIEHDVPCVFQIWQKKDYNREKVEKKEPTNFVFVTKNDNPDISFRRVGGTAGTIDVNTAEKSVQSHYFIKFTNDETIQDNIKKLEGIKFETNNTVGPKSISKQELIKEFIKVL